MTLQRLDLARLPASRAPATDLDVRAYRSGIRPAGSSALFLDRDGVLVEEKHYLRNPADVVLMPGAVELLRWASLRAMPVAVVTNQSGIARGLFGWSEFEAVETEIARQLAAHALAIDIVVVCPCHPDFTPHYGAQHAHWRKPGPGMLLAAGEALRIDLSASWLIGDKPSDVEAARAAKLAGALHLRAVEGSPGSAVADRAGTSGFATFEVTTLFEAARVLQERVNVGPRGA